jgi:hypothetical protein
MTSILLIGEGYIPRNFGGSMCRFDSGSLGRSFVILVVIRYYHATANINHITIIPIEIKITAFLGGFVEESFRHGRLVPRRGVDAVVGAGLGEGHVGVVEAGVVAGALLVLEATRVPEGVTMGGGLSLVGFEGEEEDVWDGGFATGHVSFLLIFSSVLDCLLFLIANSFIVSSIAFYFYLSLVP